MNRAYILNNIKLPINASSQEAFSVVKKRLHRAGINAGTLEYRIFRKSVDARNKNDIFFVYSVLVSGALPELSSESLAKLDASPFTEYGIVAEEGDELLSAPPLVVGSGPAGLFAALLLAERGYKPTLIERGGSVKERQRAVTEFNLYGRLDESSNIQFGAGGAGTFSDGKLVTRINDPLSSFVMDKFVEFGAPEEIKYFAKPHIGTDILSVIVERMAERIVELGGRVIYNTKYLESKEKNGKSYAVTSVGDIEYGALILAIGHSARDTYDSLISAGYSIEAKNFSVGMRIEHLTDNIDRAMYGKFAGSPYLGHAEYNLSYDTKNRGVYTFCMCPGGEVVAAASECGGVVVNGMSRHARDGRNSNSAVVCTVFKEDFGASPRAAIEFQRRIERAAFKAGGSDYSAPYILVGDLFDGKLRHEPGSVIPTYRGGKFLKAALPNEFLPDFAVDKISSAISYFDKKIKGFADPSAVLTGAETRTSAPVRILRDPKTRLAIGKNNIYPCGEGAGYAGGITSAAIDGINTALAVIKRFKS